LLDGRGRAGMSKYDRTKLLVEWNAERSCGGDFLARRWQDPAATEAQRSGLATSTGHRAALEPPPGLVGAARWCL
jgi:hypothetical protein